MYSSERLSDSTSKSDVPFSFREHRAERVIINQAIVSVIIMFSKNIELSRPLSRDRCEKSEIEVLGAGVQPA